MALSIKQVVGAAAASLADLVGDVKDIRLEEVRPQGDLWSVVFSYRRNESPSALMIAVGASDRIYKQIEVSKADGSFYAMSSWKA